MKYRGTLFGKVAGKYIQLESHSDDVDKMESELVSLRAAIKDLKAKNEKVYGWLDQANFKKNEYLARAEKAETALVEKTAQVEKLRESVSAVCAEYPHSRDGMDYSGPIPVYVKRCREALAATEPK